MLFVVNYMGYPLYFYTWCEVVSSLESAMHSFLCELAFFFPPVSVFNISNDVVHKIILTVLV